MTEKKWKTVSIPTPLHQLISDFVDNDSRYRSIAEFVSEALRRQLEIVEKTKHGAN